MSRPMYDTGYRVGHPLPNQGRKAEIKSTIFHTLTSVVNGKNYTIPLTGYGLWATRQNGMLDGKTYQPSTAEDLAEAMNHIAHKNATGVHHWVTEGEIHWAFLSKSLETGIITVSDWGVL